MTDAVGESVDSETLVANALGAQIAVEVERAEADMQTFRSRGQAVLTVAGGLVAVMAGILTFAAGDDSVVLNGSAKACAASALTLFFTASVAVAVMFRPLPVQAPTVDGLRESLDAHWENPRMDETVALNNLKHLRSLRDVNHHLANLLQLAVGAQVAGLLCVAALTLVLLHQA